MCVYVSMGMLLWVCIYYCTVLQFNLPVGGHSWHRCIECLGTCGALELPKAFLKLQSQTGSRGEQSKRMKALQKEREGGEEGVDGRGSKSGMS